MTRPGLQASVQRPARVAAVGADARSDSYRTAPPGPPAARLASRGARFAPFSRRDDVKLRLPPPPSPLSPAGDGGPSVTADNGRYLAAVTAPLSSRKQTVLWDAICSPDHLDARPSVGPKDPGVGRISDRRTAQTKAAACAFLSEIGKSHHDLTRCRLTVIGDADTITVS